MDTTTAIALVGSLLSASAFGAWMTTILLVRSASAATDAAIRDANHRIDCVAQAAKTGILEVRTATTDQLTKADVRIDEALTAARSALDRATGTGERLDGMQDDIITAVQAINHGADSILDLKNALEDIRNAQDTAAQRLDDLNVRLGGMELTTQHLDADLDDFGGELDTQRNATSSVEQTLAAQREQIDGIESRLAASVNDNLAAIRGQVAHVAKELGTAIDHLNAKYNTQANGAAPPVPAPAKRNGKAHPTPRN